MKIDLHIHTKYSADCDTEPKKIAKLELSNGIDCIAVTDHNSTSSFNDFKNSGIKLIKGEEVSTDRGHLIGLFLEDGIKSREFFAACDEIQAQGGISILPHPCRSHKDVESLVEPVDMVEIFNSRTSISGNEKADIIAEKHNKTKVCGSDAHFVSELGRAVVDVDTDDLEGARKLFLKGKIIMNCIPSPVYVHPLTWIVKGRKMINNFIKK
ncbi:MAG: PHP domain-containing protein [Candidatus Aenigmarchaeota archaeon]|nr:PHP domain-containing protein [Candidatus Aenigmarchaeota archaeon]